MENQKDLWMIEDLNGKAYWTRIGVALESVGGSYELELSILPHTGKILMKDPMPTLSWHGPELRYCHICAALLYDDEDNNCADGRGCASSGDD